MQKKSANSQKKVRERQFLDQFIILYEDFPPGKIISSESPDFVIQRSVKNRIGIEITQYEIFDSEIHPLNNQQFVEHESLLKLIIQKNDKLAHYQKKWLNAYWLLLVINASQSKSMLRLSEGLIDQCRLVASFDRIFILDMQQKRLYE